MAPRGRGAGLGNKKILFNSRCMGTKAPGQRGFWVSRKTRRRPYCPVNETVSTSVFKTIKAHTESRVPHLPAHLSFWEVPSSLRRELGKQESPPRLHHEEGGDYWRARWRQGAVALIHIWLYFRDSRGKAGSGPPRQVPSPPSFALHSLLSGS